ncbi:hypothetical protein B1B05_03965 [Domibacillus enclensis]|uniref:Uncharacterized protein n=1 Tax=Domibacillus enclensis TaxID=1017273 RepID=A0ABX4EAB2_9BACI|nr:hypothetical protein B1B05_03965 [Domibacillus enclensis]
MLFYPMAIAGIFARALICFPLTPEYVYIGVKGTFTSAYSYIPALDSFFRRLFAYISVRTMKKSPPAFAGRAHLLN